MRTNPTQDSSPKNSGQSSGRGGSQDDDDNNGSPTQAASGAKNAKGSSTDFADDNDDASSGKGDDKQSARDARKAGTPSGSPVPATLSDLLKKLFAQQPKAPEDAHPGKPDQVPANTAVKPAGSRKPDKSPQTSPPVKTAGKPSSRHAPDLSVPLPSFSSGEILARNLSQGAMQRALARGFQVKAQRSFATFGFSVTNLLLPADMTLAEARTFLHDAAPESPRSLNRYYRLVPSSGDTETNPSEAAEPARSSGGCSADRCYGPAVIGWRAALAKCAHGVKIGVIDTGIDISHPALKGHDVKLGKFGPSNRSANAELHGTGVLALLAGAVKSSTPGLIPNATFYAADIFFADENGQPVSTTMHLLEALDWMNRLGVQVLNLSLSGPKDELVQHVITTMSRTRKSPDGVTQHGTVFVAAAGNGGPGAAPSYPAAYGEVIAVTAVNKGLHGYRRANQGDYIDVAAPGVDIWTALPDGRQGFRTGTSFATPYMTAIAAAMYRGLHEHKSKQELLQHLAVKDLGAPGRDRIYGRGLVQAPYSCEPSLASRPAVVVTPWVVTQMAADR